MIFSTPITAIFLVQPRPQMIKQEIRVHIPCGWCVAKADWLIPCHSIRDDQWHCVLQIRRVFSKMAPILFFSSPVMIFGDNYCHYYFFKEFPVINDVERWVNIYLRKANKQEKCMQALNYIKIVSVWGSHNDVITVVVNARCWWGANVLQNVLKTKI